jgi:hypothetical protein
LILLQMFIWKGAVHCNMLTETVTQPGPLKRNWSGTQVWVSALKRVPSGQPGYAPPWVGWQHWNSGE